MPSPNDDQQRAHAALQELLSFGLRQKEIASALGVSQGMISHINGIIQHYDFHVAPKTVRALEGLVQATRLKRTLAALSRVPLTVLETCNAEGAPVNEGVRDQVQQAILRGFSRADGAGSSITFDLPPGVAGAFAALGRDAWILVRHTLPDSDRSPSLVGQSHTCSQIAMLENEVKKLRVAIHEIEHQIDKLHSELPTPDGPNRPKAAF